MSEIIHAVIDNNNKVINVIVVGESWDQPTIPVGDYAVSIGCSYNQNENKFYYENGEPVMTNTELNAIAVAKQDALLNQ